MNIIKVDDFIDNIILNSIPQKDTYEPENWEIGDYIMCDSNVEGQFVKGDIYKITALDLRPNFMIVKTLDSEGRKNGWSIECFHFHAVNHENILA